MLLMTDGSVMCRGDDGSDAGGRNWFRLRPDISGDYEHGAWSAVAPMKNARRYFASAVLADGRLVVAGGELSDAGGDLAAAEVYDIVAGTWIDLPVPAGWSAIGDASSCVLTDGRWLIGSITSVATAIYDPRTNTWSPGPNKDDASSEETWTLLPDGSVLTVECVNHPRSEKYVAHQNRWVTAGLVPVDLVQASSTEIGPAVLMADGRVFAIGATGHTAIYAPPANAADPGSWIAGPDLPKDANGIQLIAKDAPACLLPNGRVLCVVSPLAEGVGPKDYPGPSYFFEFDGAGLVAVSNPASATSPAYAGRLLLLPTGQVLFSNGSDSIEVYTPDGLPQPAWAPTVTAYPEVIAPGKSYPLEGRQLNGLSQAVSYGDDATMATNYPLVRVRNAETGTVWYCRTFTHSTMAVATGTATVRTNFSVPVGIPDGALILEVVANGVASAPMKITMSAASNTGPGTGGPTRRRGCALPVGAGALILIGSAIARRSNGRARLEERLCER
jgi:hypothetical protein